MEETRENISLLCKPELSSATKTSFVIKNTKNNHSSASDLLEYTNFCSKENAKLLSKTSPTQENIEIKKRLCFFIKNTKRNPFSKCLVGKHQI